MLNLKQEDMQYLEELQKDYNNTITYYKDLVDFMKGWQPSIATNKHFLTENGLKHELEHQTEAIAINKTTKDFISYICRYFRDTYGLSKLTNHMENKIIAQYVKYDFTKVNNDGLIYHDIIKNICDELEIKNFDSATIDNLRDRIVQKWKYNWENDRIKINKNKLKISDYGIYINDGWGTQCSLDDGTVEAITDLISAFSYINTGKVEIAKAIEELLKKLNKYRSVEYSEFFITHNLDFLGIISMTFFKNRSLEFKFTNDENKDKFIRVMKGEF